MDRGPIVVQAAIQVLPDDTEQTLAARVLEQEHRIYPEAVRWFMEGRLKISEGAVEISSAAFDSSILYSPGL
jgi:phosphoribosylglycinamide formyltransferase-1